MRTTPPSLVAVLALPLFVGCGGTTWINKEYRERGRPSAEEILLLPAEAHRLPAGMREAVERQLDQEVSQAFSGRFTSGLGLRGKLLPAGYGNLSWQVARGMYVRARRDGSPVLAGPAHDWLDGLPEVAKRFLTWATVALGGVAPAEGTPPRIRYLLSFYLDRVGRTEDAKEGLRLELRLVGGLYDAHRRRTVAVTWRTFKVRPTADAVRQALTGVGGSLRESLASAGL